MTSSWVLNVGPLGGAVATVSAAMARGDEAGSGVGAMPVEADSADAPLLSRAELQQLNTLVLRRVWERRADLTVVSRRFAAT